MALWSRVEQSSAKSSGVEQSGAAKSSLPVRKSGKRSAILFNLAVFFRRVSYFDSRGVACCHDLAKIGAETRLSAASSPPPLLPSFSPSSFLLPILFLLFSLPLPSSLFFLHFLSFLLLLPLLRLFASRNQKFTTFFVMLHQVREKILDYTQKGYLQPLNAAPNFFVTFGG